MIKINILPLLTLISILSSCSGTTTNDTDKGSCCVVGFRNADGHIKHNTSSTTFDGTSRENCKLKCKEFSAADWFSKPCEKVTHSPTEYEKGDNVCK